MSSTNSLQFVDNVGRPTINLVGEEWRKYPNDSSPYEVSTEGRVRRIKASGWKLIKTSLLGNHPVATLSLDGKQKTFNIKKLVASTWLTNPELMPNVKCVDGDNRNVALHNLCWYNYTNESKQNAENRARFKHMIKKFDGPKLEELISIMKGML